MGCGNSIDVKGYTTVPKKFPKELIPQSQSQVASKLEYIEIEEEKFLTSGNSGYFKILLNKNNNAINSAVNTKNYKQLQYSQKNQKGEIITILGLALYYYRPDIVQVLIDFEEKQLDISLGDPFRFIHFIKDSSYNHGLLKLSKYKIESKYLSWDSSYKLHSFYCDKLIFKNYSNLIKFVCDSKQINNSFNMQAVNHIVNLLLAQFNTTLKQGFEQEVIDYNPTHVESIISNFSKEQLKQEIIDFCKTLSIASGQIGSSQNQEKRVIFDYNVIFRDRPNYDFYKISNDLKDTVFFNFVKNLNPHYKQSVEQPNSNKIITIAEMFTNKILRKYKKSEQLKEILPCFKGMDELENIQNMLELIVEHCDEDKALIQTLVEFAQSKGISYDSDKLLFKK